MTWKNDRQERIERKSLILFQAIHDNLRAQQVQTFAKIILDAKNWAERIASDRPGDRYLAAWIPLLDGALSDGVSGRDLLFSTMLSTDEHAVALRQSSPFAGVLSTSERAAILWAFDHDKEDVQ